METEKKAGPGRPPRGAELADSLAGSPEAKQRLKAVLETLAGEKSVAEACAQLGMGEGSFHRLRPQVLAAGLASLEPKPAGRKKREPTPEERRLAELEERVKAQEEELRLLQVKEQLALALPRVLREKKEEKKRQSGAGGG